jgi:hypothetical protein
MTPLFKKLNFKYQKEILVLHAPESFNQELQEMTEVAEILHSTESTENIEFAMVFVVSKEEIESSIAAIYPKLQGDAIVWFCYPKASSKKYKCDFNRDSGWELVGRYSMEGVRQVAIDEDWSALRFRKTAYIKTLRRNPDIAISEEGKKRTGG